MATFTFTIPDELLPAVTAEFLIVSTAGATQATSPEEYFAASVVETVRQRAETYRVGPYFTGMQEPKFLADGMPNPAYSGPDAVILPVATPEGLPIEPPPEEPEVEP